MKFNRLGQTDLIVSELSFGGFPIGGDRYGNSYGPTNDAESAEAVRTAVDYGCNFFDTADVYGQGHSESLLGRTLRECGRLDDVIIATKVGCRMGPGRAWQDFSRAYVFAAVDESLRRLGREYIDLYQLHNPSAEVIEHGDVFETLDVLRQAGKIRHYGVSIHTVNEGLCCIRAGRASAIQIVYNLFSQLQPEQSAEALLPHIEQTGMGLIAREPLANGYLADRIQLSTRFEEGDIRASLSSEDRELRTTLRDSLRRGVTSDITTAQLALRFVLDEPVVSTTIVGMKTAAHVRENFRSLDLPPFDQIYRPSAQPSNADAYDATQLQGLARVRSPSRQKFHDEFALPRVPAVITGVASEWPALKKWTVDFLRTRLGDCEVLLRRPRNTEDLCTMQLSEYLTYMAVTDDEDAYYLVDWAFDKHDARLLDDYDVPDYLTSWHLDLPPERAPALRSIYLGPPGTGSRFHVDIMMTSAWNCVLWGEKEWIFVPPEESGFVYNGQVDAFAPDFERYPLYSRASPRRCIQRSGEIVFTPSGWWHQTRNLTACLSLTENFVNESNCDLVMSCSWNVEYPLVAEVGNRLKESIQLKTGSPVG